MKNLEICDCSDLSLPTVASYQSLIRLAKRCADHFDLTMCTRITQLGSASWASTATFTWAIPSTLMFRLAPGSVAEEQLVTHQGGQHTIAVIADAIMRACAVCLESNLLCFLHLLLFSFKEPPEGKELMGKLEGKVALVTGAAMGIGGRLPFSSPRKGHESCSRTSTSSRATRPHE